MHLNFYYMLLCLICSSEPLLKKSWRVSLQNKLCLDPCIWLLGICASNYPKMPNFRQKSRLLELGNCYNNHLDLTFQLDLTFYKRLCLQTRLWQRYLQRHSAVFQSWYVLLQIFRKAAPICISKRQRNKYQFQQTFCKKSMALQLCVIPSHKKGKVTNDKTL